MAEAAVTPGFPEALRAGREARRSRVLATAKWIFDVLADLIVLPLVVTYRLSIRILPERRETIFQSYSQSLSIRPGLWGIYLRRAFYRRTLTHCARECAIGFGTTFASPDVEIGEGVTIGNSCNIGHVSIGEDALIGSNVHILSGKHQHYFDRLDIPIRHQGGRFTRVRIGRDVWIGNSAVVFDDVGAQAVVSAGAVVSKPVPPRTVVAGNPGRFVGQRGGRVARPEASER